MQFLNKDKQGFTLIELLVVIALIGLLASFVLVGLQESRKKARDAKRLQDMNQIVKAIYLYYDQYGHFPPRTADSCCGGWDQGPCNGDNTFIKALEDAGLLSPVPVDPKGGTGTGCYGYNYYVYSAGYKGCDASRGKFFVLGIRDMETSEGPHPYSPGWKCPNRDWQNEFDWVTGGFEY